MAINLPGKIELSPEEEALASQIDFDFLRSGSAPDSCLASKQLTKMLLERGAVPQVRLDYFSKPEYNIGSKKSRYEVFTSHGLIGERVFEHPHFFKFLRYFIEGSGLPDSTKERFVRIVEDGLLSTSEQLERLRSFSRSEVRRLRLDPRKASEEFYKLALEADLDSFFATSVRNAVRQTRYR